jgi:hypothetical protein
MGTVVVGFNTNLGASYVNKASVTYYYSNTSNGIYYYTTGGITDLTGFSSVGTIVSANIGDGVTSIGYQAFYNVSTAFNTVSLPTTLTSIGTQAFYICPGLTTIIIPSSVTSIGNDAFRITSLTSVTFLHKTNTLSFGTNVFYSSLSNATAYMYNANQNAKNYLATNNPTVTISYLDIPCFLEGSKILTIKKYVKIEELCKGDLVYTELDGYKKIDMIGWRIINHVGVENRIKEQLYKCPKENYPELIEDLVMTGCHSILVDEFKNEKEKEQMLEVMGEVYLTGDKYRLPACVDERTVVYEEKGQYKVYHIALENDDYYMNYGIYANGLLVESCSKRYLKELSGMELL